MKWKKFIIITLSFDFSFLFPAIKLPMETTTVAHLHSKKHVYAKMGYANVAREWKWKNFFQLTLTPHLFAYILSVNKHCTLLSTQRWESSIKVKMKI